MRFDVTARWLRTLCELAQALSSSFNSAMTRTIQSVHQATIPASYTRLASTSRASLLRLQSPRNSPTVPSIPLSRTDPAILSPLSRVLHTTPTMASDEDYMSFLNKANQDTGSNQATTQSKGQFKTTDSGSQPPAEIKSACKDAFYVSDADEPFEPVSLNYDGPDLPDEGLFPSSYLYVTCS